MFEALRALNPTSRKVIEMIARNVVVYQEDKAAGASAAARRRRYPMHTREAAQYSLALLVRDREIGMVNNKTYKEVHRELTRRCCAPKK